MNLTNPQVLNVLDISTGHITKQDDELLQNAGELPIAVYPSDYGYMVYPAPDCPEDYLKELGFSKEFAAIYLYAAEEGFWRIGFDCDGMIYPELPAFDW